MKSLEEGNKSTLSDFLATIDEYVRQPKIH